MFNHNVSNYSITGNPFLFLFVLIQPVEKFSPGVLRVLLSYYVV